MNPLVILIVGSVFSVAHLGFNVYVLTAFSLNPFSEDWSGVIDQINWPIVLTWIELFFSLSVLLLVLVTTVPYIEIKLEKNPLRFSMFYYSLIIIGSVIISTYRLSETGILTMFDGLCKSDFCPLTKYREEYSTGCVFNNFAESSLVWDVGAGVDWSKEATYGKDNQQAIYDAYLSARTDSGDAIDIDSAEEMVLYHDCWYWACDSECNERYDINRMAAYASLIQTGCYLIIIVLCLIMLGAEPTYTPVAMAEPIPNANTVRIDANTIRIDEKVDDLGLEEGLDSIPGNPIGIEEESESDVESEEIESDVEETYFRDLRFRF